MLRPIQNPDSRFSRLDWLFDDAANTQRDNPEFRLLSTERFTDLHPPHESNAWPFQDLPLPARDDNGRHHMVIKQFISDDVGLSCDRSYLQTALIVTRRAVIYGGRKDEVQGCSGSPILYYSETTM